jgi:hypothetical protein
METIDIYPDELFSYNDGEIAFEDYNIDQYTYEKLKLKRNIGNTNQLFSKTGLTNVFKKNFNMNINKVSCKSDLRMFLRDFIKANPYTINVFEDNDDNICLFYNGINMHLSYEVRAMKYLMYKLGLDVELPVEVYEISDKYKEDTGIIRGTSFTYNGDHGICIRIPRKDKIISKSKSANKR